MEGHSGIENRSKIFRDQIITIGDLEIFKTELLGEIRSLLEKTATGAQNKKWLKSSEVKKLLGISTGTLQNLRMNGSLSFSKMGGIIYYNSVEIAKLLDDNEQH
jgi:hypothetical protein